VDDEPDARTLIKRLLENCEAVVTTSASVEDALERLATMSFDVIVSTGVWPSTSAFLMRDPVTSTASSFCTSSPPRSCANTGTAYEPDTTAPANNGSTRRRISPRNFMSSLPAWDGVFVTASH